MTFDTFIDLVFQHWVLMSLVLCPIVIVMMALAALRCEACGAPFGVFRRRNRTIDLCVRCALLHDIRSAKEARKPSVDPSVDPGSEGEGTGSEGADQPRQDDRRADRREDRRQDRRFAAQSTGELGVAVGHHGQH